jgi:hypothetical protein
MMQPEEQISHLRNILNNCRTRLQLLEEQASKYGLACPVHIQMEMKETQEQIVALEESIARLFDYEDRLKLLLEILKDIANSNDKILQSQNENYPLARRELPMSKEFLATGLSEILLSLTSSSYLQIETSNLFNIFNAQYFDNGMRLEQANIEHLRELYKQILEREENDNTEEEAQ